MSDLANLCYQKSSDTPSEINRYFGFFRKEKAAQAKSEIGFYLSALIQAAGGTIEGKIDPKSSRWWYNTDTLTAVINDMEVEISLGAKHRRKATIGLPHSGLFSELTISIFSYDTALQFMQSNLAAEMKKYLNQYANSSKL